MARPKLFGNKIEVRPYLEDEEKLSAMPGESNSEKARELIHLALATLLIFMLCTPAFAMSSEEFQEFTAWMNTTDQTNENKYIEGRFDCTAFAACLSINATKAGYPALVAYIDSEKFPEGHAVNVLEVEGEYRFIEPQADIEVEISNSTIVIDDPTQDNPREFMHGKNKIVLSGNVLQKVMN